MRALTSFSRSFTFESSCTGASPPSASLARNSSFSACSGLSFALSSSTLLLAFSFNCLKRLPASAMALSFAATFVSETGDLLS